MPERVEKPAPAIDDRLMKLLLERSGMLVEDAPDGADAIEKIRSGHYTAILGRVQGLVSKVAYCSHRTIAPRSPPM
jgi:hypothetical protein